MTLQAKASTLSVCKYKRTSQHIRKGLLAKETEKELSRLLDHNQVLHVATHYGHVNLMYKKCASYGCKRWYKESDVHKGLSSSDSHYGRSQFRMHSLTHEHIECKYRMCGRTQRITSDMIGVHVQIKMHNIFFDNVRVLGTALALLHKPRNVKALPATMT